MALSIPAPPFSELLLFALLLVPVIVTLRRLREESRISAIWLLLFTSVTLLALVIAINEVLRVIVTNRIRYLMPLWPLTALLAGAGLWHLARCFRRLVTVLLAFYGWSWEPGSSSPLISAMNWDIFSVGTITICIGLCKSIFPRLTY